MKLPFFKSRKRKAAEAKAAEEAAAVAQAVVEEAAAPAAPPAPKSKTRRVPAEQVVDSIGYVLAAVPSLGPTVKAWRKLGFHVSESYAWQGCQAAHIDLDSGGIRFVAADAQAEATTVANLVRSRLVLGSGLIGWTWACGEPHRSALAIGQLAGKEFHKDCEDWDDEFIQIPMELTPAAATWLEKPADNAAARPSHANSITRLDHLVLQVSLSKVAAQTYEKHFGLRGRTSAMNERYYAFLKAGTSLLEIVGPQKTGTQNPGPQNLGPQNLGTVEDGEKKAADSNRMTGGPWGLAFGSSNIDATVTFLNMASVEVTDPQRAVQGGRITGMKAPLGGIHLAFMGE